MTRYLILIACVVPTIATAATQHSAKYYLKHPNVRVALEMHCYPGAGISIAADDCRNAWAAGQRIVHSVIKPHASASSSNGVTWGDIEQMTTSARPIYPNAPEEQQTDPAYWRLRGLNKIKDYVFSCPTGPSAMSPVCKAARTAQAAPWQPTNGGRK